MEDDLESEYRELTPAYLEEIRAKRRKLDQERLKRKASTNKEENTEDPTSTSSQEELADCTLADGEVLPQYYGKCPKHLLGKPLEDVDPFYRERGIETFCVVTNRFSSKYIYRFSAKNSFFIFSPFNVIRRRAVEIASNQFFDYFIMLTIIVNCVFLALDSEVVESEYVFTAIYTLEMIIKMIARGFILEQFMYLRDLWNWLDFSVVILAYVTIISSLTPSASNLNISGLRTFRVLRALKSFTIVPGLKTIVNALLQSLKPLGEVLVIMLFLVAVISLIALQAYQGVLLRKCVRVPDASDNITTDEEFNRFVSNESNWNPVEGEMVVCGNVTTSGICPDNYKCMQDVGMNPNYGFTNFDHFGWAMLTSFQLLTLDFWENVYNMIIRAEGAWNVLFFLLSVILGPFYLLNLLLAVVTLAYGKEHEKQTKLREMREKAKENARRRNKRRRLLLQRAKTRDMSNATSFSDVVGKQIGFGITGDEKSSSIKHKNMETYELKKELSNSSELPPKIEHNNISGNESNQSIRQLTYRESRKNISMESSESSSSNQSKWKGWVRKQIRDFDATYCAWSCHPKCLGLQKILTRVVTSKIFEITITLSILANTLFLALDHHQIDEQFDYALNVGNYVFTAIFTLEAIVKIIALGVVKYLKNKWNVFDFLIVFLSLLEVGMSNSNVGGFSGLRTLRLMRVFRLARMWQTMRKLMSIILKSLSAVAYLTIVLFMVLFIFAVIGKQLYSHRYQEPVLLDGVTPRWNFVDFYHSFLLVWRVMCGEWIEPLHTCMFLADYSCIPVFLLITFIANFLVLNLFTAILLEAFNVDNLKSKQVDKKTAKLKLGVETFKKLLKKSQGRSGQGSNSITPETAVKPDSNRQSTDSTTVEKREEAPTTRSSSAANIFALNQKTTRRRKPYDSKFTWNNVNNSENSANIPMHQRMLSKRSRLGSDNSLRIQHPVTLLALDAKTTARAVVDANQDKDENLNKKPDLMKNGQAELVINNVIGKPRTKSRKLDWKKYCSPCCISKSNVVDDSTRSDSNPTETLADNNEVGSSNENDETKKEKKVKEAPDCLPKFMLCKCIEKSEESKFYITWKRFRNIVYRFVESRIFEWFVLLIILASTVCLAMEDVYLDSDPVRKHILFILEYVFTVLFTIEMLLKWIGDGFVKYFTNYWCLIDFAIVVISWIAIGAAAGEVDSLKALRTLRALRPLRAISRWQGMRVVVNALVYCIPSIGNVLCVCLLIWLVFSIIGVQLFKGQFYRCVDSSGTELNSSWIRNITDCRRNNFSWETPPINFDNSLNGMIALFQVATFEGWIEVMSAASDTTGVDNQPVREANKYSYIFFFFFVLIGSFFILNLIVGVIIESFQNLRKQTESSSAVEAFLTESQKTFYKTMRTMLNRKPKKTIPEPKNPLQLAIFKIVTHSKFEVVVFIVILMNMFTLALEHYQMSQTWVLVLRYIDIGFTTLFSIEAILKLIGTRLYYFRDPFNVFDFVVVLLSIVGFILEELLTFVVSPTLLRVVRVFRVFRVLRVIRAARGIRRLILTLMISMPALFNIAVLLAVFMLIFAILGMSFFMNVKLRGALNDLVNFRTFGSSMMLLFRLMTSAGWNDILNPLMDENDCEPHECGKRVIAIVYFVAYIFIVFLVVVNMYIAIILENFDEIFQQEETGVSQDDFEYFYVVWGRYDPKASQFVSVAELSNLLHSLHPPFQLAKPNEIKIAALNLPIVNGDKVHCLDVLFALVKRIMGEVEISDEMRQEAEARLLKSFPNRKTLKAETTTLALRQKVKAAKVIQEAWRGFHGKRKRGIDSSTSDIFGFMSPDSPTCSIPAMIGSTMTATLPIASKAQNLSVVCEILKQNSVTQVKKGSTKIVGKDGAVIKNKDSMAHENTDSLAEEIPEVQTNVVSEVPDKKEDENLIVRSHTQSEISQRTNNLPGDTMTEQANNGFMKRVNSLPNPQLKDESKKQAIRLKLNEDLIIENVFSDNENDDSDHDKAITEQPNIIKSSSEILQNTNKTQIVRSKSTNEANNKNRSYNSQTNDIPLPEIKPVTGKQLKFNPQTGKFKTKKQNAHQEETGKSDMDVDQSLTLVNEHISIES